MVVGVVRVEIRVGEAVVELQVEVGVLFDQLGLAAGTLGPFIGLVADRDVELVVDVDPRQVEEEIAPRLWDA